MAATNTTNSTTNSTTTVTTSKNFTQNATNTYIVNLNGADLLKTIYKAHHVISLKNLYTRQEQGEKTRLLSTTPARITLHSKYTTRGNVTDVIEILTRVGPHTSPENFMKHVERLRERKLMLTPAKKMRAIAVVVAAATAQAASPRASPLLRSHAAAAPPVANANATATTDADGDIEMTKAPVAPAAGGAFRIAILATRGPAQAATLQQVARAARQGRGRNSSCGNRLRSSVM